MAGVRTGVHVFAICVKTGMNIDGKHIIFSCIGTEQLRHQFIHLFDNISAGDIKGFVFQQNSECTKQIVQLSIFLFYLFVGTYRLSSHARLEAFVIQTKLMCYAYKFASLILGIISVTVHVFMPKIHIWRFLLFDNCGRLVLADAWLFLLVLFSAALSQTALYLFSLSRFIFVGTTNLVWQQTIPTIPTVFYIRSLAVARFDWWLFL